MALTLVEGFDHASTFTPFNTKGWVQSLAVGGVVSIVTGRISGNAVKLVNGIGGSTSYVRKYLAAAQTTTIAGVAVYLPNLPVVAASANTAVFDILGGCYIAIDTTGTVSLFNSAGTLVATGTAVLTAPGFHYIEVKLVCGGASGTADVRVNGVADISGAVSNFGSSHTGIQCNWYPNAWGAFTGMYWDDIYVCDASGSYNNDFLGDVHVETLWPTGDGTHSDFTPDTGTTHYTQVDDASPDDDSSYVASATAGDIDTYQFQDLSVLNGAIRGIQVCPYVRKDDATLRETAPVVRSGGTDYVGTTEALNTSYAVRPEIFETDPDTGVAWTIAGVNNAEYGTKIIT